MACQHRRDGTEWQELSFRIVLCKLNAFGGRAVRAVTHLDVSTDEARRAA
jgi:hypothetical protein